MMIRSNNPVEAPKISSVAKSPYPCKNDRVTHTMVQITWHDAHSVSGDGWLNPHDIGNEPCVVESLGWLIPNAKPNHVVLAQSYNDDELLDNVISIPVAMVVATKVLSE